MEKLIDEETVGEKWKVITEAVRSSCQQVLGPKKYTHKDWISTEVLAKIDQRKMRKTAINNSRTRSEKIRAQAAYNTESNKMVKKNIRADKRAYLNSLAVETEEAAQHGNIRAVFANIESSLEYLTSRRDP